MINNRIKPAQQFYLTVEGETEISYFEHLKNLVNACDNAEYKLKLVIRKQNPISFIKSVTPIEMRAFHIFDYEGNSPEHNKNFEKNLKDVQAAVELKKTGIEHYKIGYSNLCFELWILLHKIKYSALVSGAANYLQQINKSYQTDFKRLEDYKQKRHFERQVLPKIKLEDVLQAIKYAKEIRNNNAQTSKQNRQIGGVTYYYDNPDLTIHECVEEMLKECGIV